MVEAAVPPFAAMPNLQAGEGKRPTLAMSGLSCVLDSYARVTVDNHLPQHSDNYPGVEFARNLTAGESDFLPLLSMT